MNKREKTRILINLSTLKKGGGQNVGLNFIYSLTDQDLSDFDLFFLVAKNTEIEDVLIKLGYEVIFSASQNPVLRVFQELTRVSSLLSKYKIDVVYSYFGFAFFGGGVKQVSGSADSNLYFPEIDFWQHYTGIARLKKLLVDWYRLYGIKKSYAVVFENSKMEERAVELYGLKCTKFIKPSVNFDIHHKSFDLPFIKDSKTTVGLFLCGWQLNKNILLIPFIAKEFRERGVDFKFVLTASIDESNECMEFMRLVRQLGVKSDIHLIGSVDKSKLRGLYESVDFVFLLSLLESFSNNIIESWYFGRPLVVSNEEWSRAICEDAAIFVNRDSYTDIVNSIVPFINSNSLRDNIVSNGNRILSTYPTINQRTAQELGFLNYVSKKN